MSAKENLAEALRGYAEWTPTSTSTPVYRDTLRAASDKIDDLENMLAAANERLACARADTVEECAKVCESYAEIWQQNADEIRAIATVPSGYVCVPVELLKFLNGESPHPVTGDWFGDNLPEKTPRFWWRKYISEMLTAARKP
jgi:hypothetical protein